MTKEHIMAKAIKKKSVIKSKKVQEVTFSSYWNKINYMILAAAVITIVIGYVFMSIGPWNSFPSLDISPVILIIGYLILLPLSILYTKSDSGNKNEVSGSKELQKN